MRHSEGLFAGGDAFATFGEHTTKAVAKVGDIPSNQFLNSSDDQLVEFICAEMHIERLTLFDESATQDQKETKIDVSHDFRYGGFPGGRAIADGVEVSISIPFTGDPSLWRLRPSRYYMQSFPGEVQTSDRQGVGTLVFRFTRTADASGNELKQAYEEQLRMTKEMLGNVNVDLSRHLEHLPNSVRQEVQRRRQRLSNQATIAKVLNIPMTRRPGVPSGLKGT